MRIFKPASKSTPLRRRLQSGARSLNLKIGGAGLIADRGYLKLFISVPLQAGYLWLRLKIS